jgi:hypothetical protein
MTIDELREAVAGLTWTFAKTMPHIPHWYIVRSPANETIYAELFNAIHERGYTAKFGSAKYKYLELGDGFKYWAMTTNLAVSKILNRDEVSPKPTE